MDNDCDALLSLHHFQSDNARAVANLTIERSMADAAPVPPKTDRMQEWTTVSRNISPQPPADIGDGVAVEGNTCAASSRTLVVENDQHPEDAIPCHSSDSGALIAGPKEDLAKAREVNDRLKADGIAKDTLGGANAQHSSTCPHPAAAVDNLEVCELQDNGQ